VVDVLTIARAYRLAPDKIDESTYPPLGSFEDWSRTVRNALIWLGEDDPCATVETLRENDPSKNAAKAVIEAWVDTIGSGVEKTTKEMIETYACEFGQGNAAFKEALLAIAREGRGKFETISARRFGTWLGQHRGSVFRLDSGTYRVVAREGHTSVKLWSLEKL
jgi:putative DNA primase/helicase